MGKVGVGKSCILMQFLDNKFKIDSEATVGVEFGSKILNIGNEKVKLQIWDTVPLTTYSGWPGDLQVDHTLILPRVNCRGIGIRHHLSFILHKPHKVDRRDQNLRQRETADHSGRQ
jgi:GTPase SAR1 family protein